MNAITYLQKQLVSINTVFHGIEYDANNEILPKALFHSLQNFYNNSTPVFHSINAVFIAP